jgi:hypothetical protein
MTAYSVRAAAALGSLLISLTIFDGVASLAAPRHPDANGAMLAAQTPAAAGSEAATPQH